MTTLGVLVGHLSPSVLATLAPLTEDETARPVADVLLYDPACAELAGARDIVLGVGLRQVNDAVDAVHWLAPGRPAAFVLRADLADSAALREAARSSGIVLLTVDASANWMQLIQLLRELLDWGANGGERDGLVTDDLFRIANAIEALVDAPVTIEDPHSRVLAFSEGQERADEARRATILGRKAPEQYASRMKQRGVFRKLHSSTGPIFVPGRPPNIKPRYVAPVRASNEFLGSIWLVVDEPLDAERSRALEVAAHAVALHLLRQQLAADAWRTAELASVSTLLDGGTAAEDAARRLGLSAPAYQVVALSSRSEPSLDSEAMLLRLWDGLRISLSTRYRSAIAAKLDDTIYAVVPLADAKVVGDPDPVTRTFVSGFLRNHAPKRSRDIVVGLGSAVATAGELRHSRQQAARVLTVLRRQASGPAVADIVEVGAQALLLHVAEAMRADPSLGADGLTRLRDHDAEKNAQFLATIHAWLDAFGDTDIAAGRLNVHPNTVRYRVRQVRELGLVDLDDPVARLALLLHLHRGA